MLRLLRSALVLGVPVLLLLWGGTYLLACFDAVRAPEAPAELSLVGKKSALVVRAERIRVDILQRVVSLRDVTVASKAGGVVTSTRAAEIRELNGGFGGFRFAGSVSGVRGRVVRFADGSFEFDDLTPPPGEPGQPIPFDVVVSDLDVVFRDRRAGRDRRITAALARVASLGDDWRIESVPSVEGIGRLGLSLRLGSQGAIRFRVDAPSPLVLDDARPEILSWFPDPSTRGTTLAGAGSRPSWRSLSVAGRLSGDYDSKAGWRFEGSLQTRGTGVRAQNADIENVEVSLSGHDRLLSVRATGRAGSIMADFRGAVDPNQPLLRGKTVVTGDRLPRWISIPEELAWRGASATGDLEWAGEDRVTWVGMVRAQQFTWDRDVLSSPVARVATNPLATRVELLGGAWREVPITGELALQGGTMQGHLLAERVPVATVASRMGLTGWIGAARAEAILTGTPSAPTFEVRTRGVAQRPRTDFALPAIGFDLIATGTPSAVTVRRGMLITAEGGANIRGDWSTEKGLNLTTTVRGVDFLAVQDRVLGQANLALRITGDLANPVASGRVEAYDLSVGEFRVPVVTASLRASRSAVRLEEVRLVRGPAEVTGRVAWSAQAGLNARFAGERFQLAEYLGEDALGFLDAPEITVTGPIENPRAWARLYAKGLLVQQLPIAEASATARLENGSVFVEDLRAVVAEGEVAGRAQMDLATSHGSFEARWTKLSIEDLVPNLATATIAGRTTGAASGSFDGLDLDELRAQGTLDNLRLNRTDFGSGRWDAVGSQNRIRGNFSVGTLDRFVTGTDLSVGLDDEKLAGLVEVFNFEAQDLISSLGTSLSDENRLRLSDLTGTLNAALLLGGDTDRPEVQAQTLLFSGITLGGVEFGDLDIQGRGDANSFELQRLRLTGPSGSLNLKGSLDRNGALSADGELRELKLDALRAFDDQFTGLSGTLDELTFLAGGTREAPELQASATLSGLLAAPDAKDDQKLRLLVDSVDVSPGRRENGTSFSQLLALGRYFYRGFQGDLVADIPFDLNDDGPVKDARIRLGLARRDLKEIAALIDGFDADRTEGGVSGEVILAGPLNALGLSGNIEIQAPKLARNGIDAILEDARLGVNFGGETIRLDASARSSRGGSLTATTSTTIEGMQDLALLFRPGRFDDLLDNPVTGQVSLNGIQARQKFTGNAYVDAAASGTLTVSGALRAPLIAGDLLFRGVDSVLPVFEAQPGAPLSLPVNPTFAVNIRTADAARIRSTGADLLLEGAGRLTGTLLAPMLDGELGLTSGTLQLPNHKVRLEPGGRIRALFDMSPATGNSLLDVDLEGRTNVTTRRFGDTVERYDVQLRVRGDLLREGALTLTAESDPPDLTQNQILSLLGQTQLLESFGGGVSAEETERRIRSALAGYAIPTVFEALTADLAKGLKLDYLTLEYNQYEFATLVFSENLGWGWSFIGRRQIGVPPPGFPARYEWKLQYRPSRNRLLNRFSFMLGVDQDRPWKAALEYGIRF